MKIHNLRRIWWRFLTWLERDAESWLLRAIAVWIALGVAVVVWNMMAAVR